MRSECWSHWTRQCCLRCLGSSVSVTYRVFHLIPRPACFPVAAPAAPGGPRPAPSHRVPRRWSAPELCTPGSPPSCATTPPLCRLPSPVQHPPRSSPPTPSSRTRLCPPTPLRTPSPSLRRLGGGWRRRGGGTPCSRPNRGEREKPLTCVSSWFHVFKPGSRLSQA